MAAVNGNHSTGKAAHNLVAEGIYEKCTYVENKEWFSLSDCAYRYFLVQLATVWALLSSPISFAVFVFRYIRTHEGLIPAVLLVVYLPFLPLSFLILQMYKDLSKWLTAGDDWKTKGPGRVFFIAPDGILANFIWSTYLTQSMCIGGFFLYNNTTDPIAHTWQDYILTKKFWRETLASVGARHPRNLCRWDGASMTVNYPGEVAKNDLVVKLYDSYLGIGDSFWNRGQDFNTAEDVRRRMGEEYANKPALILELIRPKRSMGVHSLDIVTITMPDGQAKVLSCLIWTDCETDSSHSCRAGYTIDVATGKMVARASWYSAYFATMKAPQLGEVVPGVREACAQAVAAHEAIAKKDPSLKWVTVVGWDCMVLESGEVCFFEGNFGCARVPRRIFLSFGNLWTFMTQYCWPWSQDRLNNK